MPRLPLVAIVGFPNVGKSTLFNRLVRQKKALVHNLAGMTRDRVSATAEINGRRVEFMDTGGLIDVQDKGEPLAVRVHEMAWDAARRADILLLVLDGIRGLLPVEKELFQDLKKLNKPLLVAVNKIDSEWKTPEQTDFYSLGEKNLLFVSAEHKLNIGDLEEAIAAALPAPGAGPAEEEVRPLRIAITGRVNVGKSSLANRLCGEERFIVSELPGTTRDSTDVLIRRGDKAYRLIDTAGIRKLAKAADVRESAGIIKTRKNIDQADVIILVLDALEFPTRQDTAVAAIALESGKPLVLAVNKWDKVREGAITQQEIQAMVFSRLDFIGYAPVVTVSALTGKNVVSLLDEAERVWLNGQKTVGTADLNRFLKDIHVAHAPLSKNGRRFKIKYMTQAGTLPPTFRLFGHAGGGFAPAYEKFFEQHLREEFGFSGNPIRLMLHES
jgi:GTP-binding protein